MRLGKDDDYRAISVVPDGSVCAVARGLVDIAWISSLCVITSEAVAATE